MRCTGCSEGGCAKGISAPTAHHVCGVSCGAGGEGICVLVVGRVCRHAPRGQVWFATGGQVRSGRCSKAGWGAVEVRFGWSEAGIGCPSRAVGTDVSWGMAVLLEGGLCRPYECHSTENACTALGALPTGYSGLDLACTLVTDCSDAAACAAGYNGAPSARACSTNGAAFDTFTGCAGVGIGWWFSFVVHLDAVKVGVQKEFPHPQCMHVESAVVLVGKGHAC